jgi:hypothetical protein
MGTKGRNWKWDKPRKRDEIAINRADNPKGGNPKYRLNEEEVKIIHEYRRIVNEAIDNGVNPSDVKHGWLKTEKSSLFFKNPLFDDGGLTAEKMSESIDNILSKWDAIKIKGERINKDNKKAIKVTISDSHVGMNPVDGLFQYEYDANIYQESLDKVFDSVMKEYNTHGTFEVLFLDDLGDLADGWNGYTTRGGHELPQNMSNIEVFETCVDAKVALIRKMVEAKVAKKVMIRSVVNDNHSGDFGYVINLTIKKIINMMYSKKIVDIDILTSFMEARMYGDHCFILTHGKDKKDMRYGLPIVLNEKAMRLISDFIEHYRIDSKYIHVEKGDLHQIGYQKVKRFDYRNFMSFAPPSSWVQHNYGDSYSGYSIQVVPKHSNEISHTDYFLDYKQK